MFLSAYRSWDHPAAVARGQSFNSVAHGWAPAGSHHVKYGNVAESVFIAGLFVLAANELAAIARIRHQPAEAGQCLTQARSMEEAVRKHGWDGAWFVRAYDDFGRPVGSKGCAEGKIFIESQGMCIMAGIGLTDGRAKQALDSVRPRADQ